MSDKLKPCPHCGREDCCVTAEDHGTPDKEMWWGEIFCQGCHMNGPDIGPEDTFDAWYEKAVEVWNALPRRLHWTTEKPTKEGWYFIKYKGKVTICYATYPKGSSHMTYRVIGSPDAWSSEYADEWAGQIDEPKEKKQ